jgi:diguanylate cyclase (GGDEF)-like protein/PAS domain S-box-containing protein
MENLIMLTLPHYKIHTQIYESANSIVYRGIRKIDNQAVILKILKQDYPTPEELTRYQQEYDITKSLNIEGVIKTYSLEKYQNTLIIVLEDFGAKALKSKNVHFEKGAGLPPDVFLKIAIQITNSLAQIHAANVIHKDINPTNIVWNKKTEQLKIIDFGISTRLPRETLTLKNIHQLEGTLAYISPEQTGRMNRAIDYRTDLYSLGITFYEMLTGKLPFESENPLELVHCHIAKNPIPLSQINHNLPPILEELVMKLMSKNVEERYQSALGIKADLEKCLANLSYFPRLKGFNFELAQNDFSGKFQIPQKLYGRENEINDLLQAFERIAQSKHQQEGNSNSSLSQDFKLNKTDKSKIELILVAGYSGVGKTALVREIHKPLTSKQGYFAAGKFDQLNRNIPYSGFSQAFNDFCNTLLTEAPEKLIHWRNTILKAVHNNGQILIDIIPQLELVIGSQPPVAEVDPQEAQNRFNLVFQNFLRALCQPTHPLVLFIDDLQWADSASLNLLSTLMRDTENQAFLLIGAYRDNEVDAYHPLMKTVTELKKNEVTVNTLFLQNLSQHDVKSLIAETLHAQADKVEALTYLVYEKTQGNAFFTQEFLKSLYEQGLLTFEVQTQQWQWQIEKIAKKAKTDNVVDLMASKIGKLPSSTQDVLKLAACLGNQFDLKTLSLIYIPPKASLKPLWTAIEEGLLLPLDNHYKYLEKIEKIEHFKMNALFKFQHDRVQQAASSLITETNKKFIHLQIGQLLLANTNILEEKLFEIVDHLNVGQELLTKTAEKIELAQLNLAAGKKAKNATAYTVAEQYLNLGLNNLSEKAWKTDYDLTLSLYKEKAEVEYLNGDFEKSEALIRLILEQAHASLEKAEVYKMLVVQYTLKAKYTKAIEMGRQALHYLDIDLPEIDLKTVFKQEVSLAKKLMGYREIASLAHQPQVTEPKIILTIKLLRYIALAAYFSNQSLWTVIIMKNVNFCLKYGQVPETSPTFCAYGMILGAVFQEYQAAYQFGLVAIKVAEQFKSNQCQAYGMTGIFLMPWVKPLNETHILCQKAYKTGLDSGDLQYAGYIITWELFHTFYQGNPLKYVLSEASKALSFTQKTKNQLSTDILLGIQRILFHFKEIDDYRLQITEAQYLEKSQQHQNLICLYAILKCQLYFLDDKPEEALKYAEEASKKLTFIRGFISNAEYYFYHSLSLTALYSSVSSEKQQQFLVKIEENQKQMKRWMDLCKENFQHKYLLIAAEWARINGDDLEAIALYKQAIESAKKNHFIHQVALGNELAAKFWLNKGFESCAKTHLTEAHYNYQLWGGLRKVNQLEEQYPFLNQKTSINTNQKSFNLLNRFHLNHSVVSIQSASALLDLNTVIKASQTLSQEIVLSRLLEKMMLMVIENAGAEKGVLILPKNQDWFVEAEGDVASVKVLQSKPLDKCQHICATIIHYVIRTQEPVVLHDGSHDEQFSQMLSLKSQPPKSVLCLPLLNKGQTTGLLYLENNLTTYAFTPERLEILNLLSSQIVISIENAKLYAELHESESRLTQFLEAMPVAVGVLDAKGQPYYLNQRGKDILGKGIVEKMKPEQIPEFYHVYLAGKNQPYPFDKLPIVRALKGETSTVDNIEIYREDDQIIPLEERGTPIFDENGKVIYALNVFQDITQRKQREAEHIHFIQEQEAKNAALRVNKQLQQEIEERKRAELALEKANEELKRLAVLDDLTQIANRRRLNEYLEQTWQNLTQQQQPLSFILCDIDYFKYYNDTYGHQAGDKCLQQVALAMKYTLKQPVDLIARYGGEEFAVILPYREAQGAMEMAYAMQNQLKSLKLIHAKSKVSQYVTLSIGISTTIPKQTDSAKQLIKTADNALYEAKAQGRNCAILKTF